MKTIRILAAVITLLTISMLAACSDQFVNSGSMDKSTNQSGAHNYGDGLPVIKPEYRSVVSLKPDMSYTFVAKDVGFKTFTGINVSNLKPSVDEDRYDWNCRDIAIFGGDKAEYPIECNSSSFSAKVVTIQNTSDKSLELNVLLRGVRVTLSDGNAGSE